MVQILIWYKSIFACVLFYWAACRPENMMPQSGDNSRASARYWRLRSRPFGGLARLNRRLTAAYSERQRAETAALRRIGSVAINR